MSAVDVAVAVDVDGFEPGSQTKFFLSVYFWSVFVFFLVGLL